MLVLSEILNRERRNEIREDKGRLRGKPSLFRGEISRNLGSIMYKVHQMCHSRVALSFPAARGGISQHMTQGSGRSRREEKAEIERV